MFQLPQFHMACGVFRRGIRVMHRRGEEPLEPSTTKPRNRKEILALLVFESMHVCEHGKRVRRQVPKSVRGMDTFRNPIFVLQRKFAPCTTNNMD